MNGQTDPFQNKYAHLDHLSTEALEALLRADIESTTDDDDEAMFYILEILERREKEHPTGRLSDVDQAWAEFQKHYNTPEGDGQELYPCEDTVDEDQEGTPAASDPSYQKPVRIKRIFKHLVAVAAILMAFLAVAQASGFDVLGALGRWTEENFHFTTSDNGSAASSSSTVSGTAQSSAYYQAIASALTECGITEELAPTWYPDGFESEEPSISSNGTGDMVYCPFFNETDLFFDIIVFRYNSPSYLENASFEKDGNLVEEYTSNGRTFYILSNIDSITATWSDASSLIMAISGNLSKDEIISIIDSLGG